jgi:hypothetical protein
MAFCYCPWIMGAARMPRGVALVLLAAVFGNSCIGTRTPTRPEPLLVEAPRLRPLVLEAPRVVALPPDEDAGLLAPEVVRHAIHWGAPLDGRSALDLMEGNLVEVDLPSGAVTILKARFAMLSQCVPVRLPADTLLLCGTGGDHVLTLTPHLLTGPFVVSHALEGRPILEHGSVWPPAGFAGYWVSDDGGIAGSFDLCNAERKVRRATGDDPYIMRQRTFWSRCTRAGDATGRQYVVDGAFDDFQPVRWVPRGDGAVALVVNAVEGKPDAWGLVDGTTGKLHRWMTAPDADVRRALEVTGGWGHCEAARWERCVDRSWSLTAAGGLLGWILTGDTMGRIEILADGTVHRSAERFDRLLAAGPVALARATDGRVVQTLDHGVTWSEIPFPPEVRNAWPVPWGTPLAPVPVTIDEEGSPKCDVSGKWCARPPPPAAPPPPPYTVCSPVGCDLGGWLRVGWSMPTAAAARTP